ncbi:hypothetical protein NKH77_02980 [Streptomyces sp. M19]
MPHTDADSDAHPDAHPDADSHTHADTHTDAERPASRPRRPLPARKPGPGGRQADARAHPARTAQPDAHADEGRTHAERDPTIAVRAYTKATTRKSPHGVSLSRSC